MFDKIVLEMSLKPFKQTDGNYIRCICRNFFRQWQALLYNRKEISVMLWTADGSEILDYSGIPEKEFEWCKYIGTANKELASEEDIKNIVNLHQKKREYISNPPIMTYKILKEIVQTIMEVGLVKSVVIDINADPSEMLNALRNYGYNIINVKNNIKSKSPAITISRHNNAFVFSVYNPDTTDTLFMFHLGAPIMSGGETKIANGFAEYSFSRCEHRECRVFIKQKDGVVSLKEGAPVMTEYRRRIMLSGLNDAEVVFFPEKYCLKTTKVAYCEGFKYPRNFTDFEYIDSDEGGYLKGEHISGEIQFFFSNEKML